MARKLCNCCQTRPVGSGGGDDAATAKGLDECNPCYTEGGWENEHNDHSHDSLPVESPERDGCWICHPGLNLAQKPYVKKEQAGHHSPRRKQLNHRTQCTHPQTPIERRKCREKFWASQTSQKG